MIWLHLIQDMNIIRLGGGGDAGVGGGGEFKYNAQNHDNSWRLGCTALYYYAVFVGLHNV